MNIAKFNVVAYRAICIIMILVCLLTYHVSAQQSMESLLKGRANALEPSLSAKDATKLVGKDIYICDTVFNYKYVNDSLKMLLIGNKQSKRSLTIILKGNNIISEPKTWVGRKLCVEGVVILYKNRPAIIVTNRERLGTRIQI